MDINYYIFFSIGSLIDLILLLILYFSRKNKSKSVETRVFKRLLILTPIIVAQEVFISFGIDLLTPFLRTVVLKLYPVLCEFWTTLLVVYIIFIMCEEKKEYQGKRKIYLSVVYSTYLLSSIASIVSPIKTQYGVSNTFVHYMYGNSINFISINAMIDILFILYVLFKMRTYKDKRLLPLYTYIIGSILYIILRMYFPIMVFTSLIQTVVLLIMHEVVENPALKKALFAEQERSLALQSERAKTDFLANMSHEIKTPLNAIVGLSEDNLSFKEELPSDVVENCNDIMDASCSLLDLITNILDFNKLEAGKIQIIESSYKFRDEMVSLCKKLSSRINPEEVKFNLNMSRDVPEELVGDINRLKEVINYTIINSIKYTKKGNIDLVVKCNVDKKNDIANLNIFCSSTREYEDIQNNMAEQLGYEVAKKLIALMGGYISISSAEGMTTFNIGLNQKIGNELNDEVFIFTKPKYDNKDRNIETPVYKEKVKPVLENNTTIVGMDKKNILVVDDNFANVKVAKRVLRGFNVEIDECYDGRECLDKIKEGKKYDLILMDIMMPNLGGVETLNELKKDASFNTPVIALTADALSGTKEKYESLGFIDYLSKPVSKENMRKVLEKVLNMK